MKTTITTPTGTTGLAVEPWARGEIYAVAADWRQASAPVLRLTDAGWLPTGRQACQLGGDPRAHLAAELEAAMRASGERGDLTERAASIANEADDIDDGKERTYYVALVAESGWDLIDKFTARDDAAANQYAEANHGDAEWYVLDARHDNINA